MSKPIKRFHGEHLYLCNFYPCKVEFQGRKYHNSEAAFQAQKTTDPEIREEFTRLTNPADAKRAGKRIPLRDGWNDMRVAIMEEVVEAKFRQNPYIAEKLLATGECWLEEGNHHDDRFWGTVDGKGSNKLGMLLMRVRDKLRQERDRENEA